ncbi:MAG: outer membrane lipid asymmetry maintenance protein MlaD [Pseudomonadota bacterium]|nr:outer membrane lipid asymmetry maintenance protein MlaD [Pseudomonadota bacterium]
MKRNAIEAVMGAVVLITAAFFLSFAYGSANLSPVDGFEYKARFSRIDGLMAGSDVRISGVKVGSVLDLNLDRETFFAFVRLSLNKEYKLPIDTLAVVSSDSLLGDKYLDLEPGIEEEFIKPGGLIEYTKSSVSIEQLLGKVIYSLQNMGGDDE